MKKLITSFLILLSITSQVYAEEVIDVFEEYASIDDSVVKTFSMSLNTPKNESSTQSFFTQCDNDFSISITKNPDNGNLIVDGNNQFTYTPNKNFTGTDSFCYRIFSDGIYSNISRCNINITDENTKNIKNTNFYYEDTKNHSCDYMFKKLAEQNIVKGEKILDKFYFYPDSHITRSQAINYICAVLNTENNQDDAVPVIFKDDNLLSEQLKINSAICYSSGILTGQKIGEDIYLCPNEPLKRAEMFSMIERATLSKSNNDISLLFPDKKAIPDYAKLSVKNLVANGFLENSDRQLLRPADNATKAEFSELLYKLMELNEESVTKTLSMRIKEGFYAKIIA